MLFPPSPHGDDGDAIGINRPARLQLYSHCVTFLQLFKFPLVLPTVPANNPNLYLLILAALGWAISLYFGFFRYRQYVWSRNKVRYDLLQKIDRQRSDLAAKLLLFCEISTPAKPRKARLRSLLRRYFATLQQISFYQDEDVFDEAILNQLRTNVIADLSEIFSHDGELTGPMKEWITTAATPGNFFSTLTFE